MLPIIDANVALRYLLNDLPDYFAIAESAIANGCEITPEALAEVVYVLNGVYRIPRAEIADALLTLLETVYIERYDEIAFALTLYASCSLDFVDCVLVGMNSVSGREIITFDKKLKNRISRNAN